MKKPDYVVFGKQLLTFTANVRLHPGYTSTSIDTTVANDILNAG
ncbi:hypothetical protein [Segetibacter koreensis]|nr:hypothetical protein [Segetibacter koreensis]